MLRGGHVVLVQFVQVVAFMLLLPSTVLAVELTGEVVCISDSDTIKVMHDGKPE